MLIQVLAFLHQGTTLLFGILISAFFLGVKQDRKNTMHLLLFFGVVSIVNLLCNMYLGETTTSHIYPLIVHLPLILTTILVFVILCGYVCHVTESVFAKGKRNLLVYFRESAKQQEIRRYTDLIEMQLLSQQKEIEQVRSSQTAMTILRHDMRHHLNVILAQLQSGNIEDAVGYIHQVGDACSDAELTDYCENEMLNAVLSIWQTRFTERGLTLNYDISVKHSLSCPDLALCTILSNALENAMNSLIEADVPEEKWVRLRMFQKDSRLMIQMENPCSQIPRFVDGIPVSEKKDHGVGTKSMVYYVEKLHGQCSFSVQDHKFLLRIIL